MSYLPFLKFSTARKYFSCPRNYLCLVSTFHKNHLPRCSSFLVELRVEAILYKSPLEGQITSWILSLVSAPLQMKNSFLKWWWNEKQSLTKNWKISCISVNTKFWGRGGPCKPRYWWKLLGGGLLRISLRTAALVDFISDSHSVHTNHEARPDG